MIGQFGRQIIGHNTLVPFTEKLKKTHRQFRFYFLFLFLFIFIFLYFLFVFIYFIFFFLKIRNFLASMYGIERRKCWFELNPIKKESYSALILQRVKDRIIMNTDELRDGLKEIGVDSQIVIFEHLNFTEQIEITKKFNILIGSDGFNFFFNIFY